MNLRRILSVRELTRYIKQLLETDLTLYHLWVRGEVSNFKHHSSGHIYFTLKDETASVHCVMFRSKSINLTFMPEHGMRVLARGYISVFERDGQYQLYVEEIQPDGLGSLHLAFEQLKHKLEAEGLFNREHKKKLPFLPKKIGIITSLTGAALQDMLSVIKRRLPCVHILIAPVTVQGEAAPKEIIHALKLMDRLGDIDVIILGRGGGSLEELWAFNHEQLARAIFAATTPIVSAVGHETDFTIADFVADLRAPTPSAAGEMVVPELEELRYCLNGLGVRLRHGITSYLQNQRQGLEMVKQHLVFLHPRDRLNQNRQRLDYLCSRLVSLTQNRLINQRQRLNLFAGKLATLSPLSILHRGYTVCLCEGKVVKATGDVQLGDKLELRVSDGVIFCEVKATAKNFGRGNNVN